MIMKKVVWQKSTKSNVKSDKTKWVFIGPESDHYWLWLSVAHPLTDSCLVNFMPLNDVSCLMMSQVETLNSYLKQWKGCLEMLLMLMMRIVLATVYCMLGSWGLVIKPAFCSDFQYKVWSRFWSWSSGVWSIFCRWCFAEVMKLNLGRDFEDEVWSRFGFELVIWPNRLLWKDELNPRVRCAFGNVFFRETPACPVVTYLSIISVFSLVMLTNFQHSPTLHPQSR